MRSAVVTSGAAVCVFALFVVVAAIAPAGEIRGQIAPVSLTIS